MTCTARTARRRRVAATTKRVELRAYWSARVAAGEAADPMHPYKLLYRLADPAIANRLPPYTIVAGTPVVLPEHYELRRRIHLLRAWCAQRLGWREALASELRQARNHRRTARSARRTKS